MHTQITVFSILHIQRYRSSLLEAKNSFRCPIYGAAHVQRPDQRQPRLVAKSARQSSKASLVLPSGFNLAACVDHLFLQQALCLVGWGMVGLKKDLSLSLQDQGVPNKPALRSSVPHTREATPPAKDASQRAWKDVGLHQLGTAAGNIGIRLAAYQYSNSAQSGALSLLWSESNL